MVPPSGADCSIHPQVTIGRNSLIGDRVTHFHPGVVIGDNVTIGDGTTIFPNVSIYDDTSIGARCRIHSGTVIGADWLQLHSGRERQTGSNYFQVGKVVIEDDVEIGANTVWIAGIWSNQNPGEALNSTT
ncbi:MAG: hypothetical protein IPJ07_23410 [Acidobacteria bacterium]|nr:hypothetical protein [Acidobacteriota bacterium]